MVFVVDQVQPYDDAVEHGNDWHGVLLEIRLMSSVSVWLSVSGGSMRMRQDFSVATGDAQRLVGRGEFLLGRDEQYDCTFRKLSS